MAVLDSQTTDNDGKATLSAKINSSGTQTLTISESTTNTSTDVEIEAVEVDRIDVSLSKEIVADGIDSIVTAIPYNGNSKIPNLLIHIDGNDYVTNTNGEATHIFRGTGRGLYGIEVGCGNYTDGIAIEDVYQYYNQKENAEYNLNYFTMLYLSAIRKFNGLELTNSPSAEGTIKFIYPDYLTETWSFRFDVVSVVKNTSIEVCGVAISYDLLKNNPKIDVRVIQTNGNYIREVWHREGNVTRRIASDTTFEAPSIKVRGLNVATGITGSLVIDNIILEKVG